MGIRLATITLVVLAACTSVQPRTEVVLRIEAEPGVAAAARRLHIVVQGGPNRSEDMLAVRSDRTYPDTGDVAFPMELALVPADGDASRVFEVTVTAQRGDAAHTALVTQRVVSGYVSGRTLSVVLRLEESCIDLPACDPGNTCHLSRCVDAYVDPATLASYAELDAGVEPTIDSDVDTGVGPDAGRDSSAAVDAGPPPWPRPISPLSTSTATSRHPTLRWELPAGATDAYVELCDTRDCATPYVMMTVMGTSFTVPDQNSGTVMFWRLRDGPTGAPSPTWQVIIPFRSSTHADRSYGSTLDMNGDGLADLAISAPGFAGTMERVHVFFGRAGALGSTPDLSFEAPESVSRFGGSMGSAGDINGDGYGDLVVGASGVGYVYLYYGGPAGSIATIPADEVFSTDRAEDFGYSVAGIGDANGDGYGDIAIGTPGLASGIGGVDVFYGSAAGLGADPDVILSGRDDSNARHGLSVAGAGDVNCDGLGDLVVGAFRADEGTAVDQGRAYVYLGAASGLALTPTMLTVLAAGAGAELGVEVASAGDVDGDGCSDVLVGATGANAGQGALYLFRGDTAGPSSTPSQEISGMDGPGVDFAAVLTSAGDISADGFSDIVVGEASVLGHTGAAFVYRGSLAGLVTTPHPGLIAPGGTNGYFGSSIVGGGDVNGDGYIDVAVGAPGSNTSSGNVYVYRSDGSNLGVSPADTLMGPDGIGDIFGTELAN